jgi:hypothetical protein
MSFVNDLKVAFRSLARTKGLALTVVLTLALGIGANSAIFALVRGVLLKPLINRDEGRLVYIRQSAPGVGDDNTTFSVPEIQDKNRGDGVFPNSRHERRKRPLCLQFPPVSRSKMVRLLSIFGLPNDYSITEP